MELVHNYEEYRELKAEAKAKGLKTSNLFMLPDTLKSKISERKLCFERNDDYFLIAEDEGVFYRCYFDLNPDAEIINAVSLDKDAVIEFPYSNFLNEKQEKQIQRFSELGFVLERESSEMLLDVKNISDFSVKNCSFAQSGEGKRIRELLDDTFDPLFAFLPSVAEIEEKILENRIFVNRDDEEIIAVLNSSLIKNNAEISHLAVDARYRGRGCGTNLVGAFLWHYQDFVCGYRHWVDIHNDAAIRLYQKFGFRFGIRKANEYTRRL